MRDHVPQDEKTASDALATPQRDGAGQHTREAERGWLYTRGWRERSCAGPWRFYRTDWKPIACYTLHDAVALQREMDKRVKGDMR